jgi:hypothetical protein
LRCAVSQESTLVNPTTEEKQARMNVFIFGGNIHSAKLEIIDLC